MPKVSQEHVEARRAQILEGARRAFSRWGYDGATVARIEEETGLSRGAIFNYFDGKLDLFLELSREVNRHYTRLVVEQGFDDALREMARENPEWIGVFFETQTRLRHDPEFERRMEPPQEELQKLLDWFRTRQEDGRFRSDLSLRDLARFATIVLNGLALRVLAGDETDVESVVRLLNDALSPVHVDAAMSSFVSGGSQTKQA